MVGCVLTFGALPRLGAARGVGAGNDERIARLAERIADARIPYRRGGRDPRGFDCSGLVWYVHRQVGLDVPRRAEEQSAVATPIDLEDLAPGDLLFFRLRNRRHVDHVGIYVGPSRLVHASLHNRAVSYAYLDDTYFLPRVAAAGRLWGGALQPLLPAPLDVKEGDIRLA
jgi:cell wall-associated NlpC family hydrolase